MILTDACKLEFEAEPAVVQAVYASWLCFTGYYRCSEGAQWKMITLRPGDIRGERSSIEDGAPREKQKNGGSGSDKMP